MNLQSSQDFVDTEHDEDDEYGGIELDDEDFERLDSQERLYSQDLIQKFSTKPPLPVNTNDRLKQLELANKELEEKLKQKMSEQMMKDGKISNLLKNINTLEKDKNTLLMKFEEQKKHWEAAKAQESKELNKKLESLATELQYKEHELRFSQNVSQKKVKLSRPQKFYPSQTKNFGFDIFDSPDFEEEKSMGEKTAEVGTMTDSDLFWPPYKEEEIQMNSKNFVPETNSERSLESISSKGKGKGKEKEQEIEKQIKENEKENEKKREREKELELERDKERDKEREKEREKKAKESNFIIKSPTKAPPVSKNFLIFQQLLSENIEASALEKSERVEKAEKKNKAFKFIKPIKSSSSSGFGSHTSDELLDNPVKSSLKSQVKTVGCLQVLLQYNFLSQLINSQEDDEMAKSKKELQEMSAEKLPSELFEAISTLTKDPSANETPLLHLFSRYLNVFHHLKAYSYVEIVLQLLLALLSVSSHCRNTLLNTTGKFGDNGRIPSFSDDSYPTEEERHQKKRRKLFEEDSTSKTRDTLSILFKVLKSWTPRNRNRRYIVKLLQILELLTEHGHFGEKFLPLFSEKLLSSQLSQEPTCEIMQSIVNILGYLIKDQRYYLKFVEDKDQPKNLLDQLIVFLNYQPPGSNVGQYRILRLSIIRFLSQLINRYSNFSGDYINHRTIKRIVVLINHELDYLRNKSIVEGPDYVQVVREGILLLHSFVSKADDEVSTYLSGTKHVYTAITGRLALALDPYSVFKDISDFAKELLFAISPIDDEDFNYLGSQFSV